MKNPKFSNVGTYEVEYRVSKENYKNMANKLINNIENDLSFNDIKELYRLKVE